MTILNLRFQCYLVLSPIHRDITFNIIWFIVDITQILTVRRDLIFAGLDSKEFLEIKEFINFFLANCLKLLLNYVFQI